jgi:hypothetical protein
MPRNRTIAIIVSGSALCAATGASLTPATWPVATIRQVPTVSLVDVARTTSAALPAGQGPGQGAISPASDSLALAGAKNAAAQAGRKLTLAQFIAAQKAHIEHIKHIEHIRHMTHVAYIAYVAHEVHVELLAEQAQQERQAAAAQRVAAEQAAAHRAAAAAKRAAAHRAAAAAKRAAAHRAAAAAQHAAAQHAAAQHAAARRAAAQQAVQLAAVRQQRSSTQSLSARSDSATVRVSDSTTVRAGNAPSGSPREIAQQMLEAEGQARQFSCLDALWNRESGWNLYATNPTSGAYGIPQSLPATKMTSAGSDWRTNATTQIRWGLSYIAAVYGSPCAAWSHEETAGWY